MQVGQLAVGIGIGLGLAVGSVGSWTAFQRLQAGNSAAVAQSTQSVVQPVLQPVVQPVQPSPQPAALVAQTALTQAENDYLYDLSVALQPAEQRRLSNAEKLALGRQVADWLQQGQDYWGVRTQFDQLYRGALAGDYGHNRDVYIKFATERLAPAFVATLTPPPEVIVKTRTRYVETPGKTQIVQVPGETKVIREVLHVPDPYPVPQPFPVPVPAPRPPHPPHHPHHPDPDDQAQLPDQDLDETPHPHHPDTNADQPKPDWPDEPQAELPDQSPDHENLGDENSDELAAEPEQTEAPSLSERPSRPETLQVSAEPVSAEPQPEPAQ